MTQQRRSEGERYLYIGHQVRGLRLINRETQDTCEADDTD